MLNSCDNAFLERGTFKTPIVDDCEYDTLLVHFVALPGTIHHNYEKSGTCGSYNYSLRRRERVYVQ